MRFLVALAFVLTASCPDPPPNKKTCNTVTDCNIDEHCSHGFCEPNGGEGEGAAGEGEGEGEGAGDDPAVDAFCNAQAACIGQDASTCIQQDTQGVDQMRAIGSPVCLAAADAFDSALSCAAGQSCGVVQNQQLLTQVCPDAGRLQSLVDQCTGQPGEGEGEGEPLQCPQAAALRGSGAPTSVEPISVNGSYDATTAAACSSNGFGASASIQIELVGTGASVVGGVASFDGVTSFDLQNTDFVDTVLNATACAADVSSPEIAIALTVVAADGSEAESNAVCGFLGVTAGEGEGEGGQ